MTTVIQVTLVAVLATILVVSGTLKILDRKGTTASVTAFGLPSALTPFIASALPAVELLGGLGLLLAEGRAFRVVAICVTALFLAFTALVGVSLLRGRRPACHCFGSLDEEPISWSTFGRNVVLTAAATPLIAISAWPGVAGSVRSMVTDQRYLLVTFLVVAAAIALLGVRHLQLAGKVSALSAALETLSTGQAVAPSGTAALGRAGEVIPELTVLDPDGAEITLPSLVSEKAQLLVFTSPTCGACLDVVQTMPAWGGALLGEVEVKLVSIASREESLRSYERQRDMLLIDETGAARDGLGVPGTPSAFLLGTNGLIGAGPASGAEQIGELLATMVQAIGVNVVTGSAHQSLTDAAGISQGQSSREDNAHYLPEPGTRLSAAQVKTEAGEVLALEDALRSVAPEGPLAVVAWRHDCGYCAQIAEPIAQRSAHQSVVLLVDEPIETVRAQGITGPVFQTVDQPAMALLGVPGTPAGVPVSDGVVTGLGAVGGPHVLELIDEQRPPLVLAEAQETQGAQQ